MVITGIAAEDYADGLYDLDADKRRFIDGEVVILQAYVEAIVIIGKTTNGTEYTATQSGYANAVKASLSAAGPLR